MKIHEVHLNTPDESGKTILVGMVCLVDYDNEDLYLLPQNQPGRLGSRDGRKVPFSQISRVMCQGERAGEKINVFPDWQKHSRTKQ